MEAPSVGRQISRGLLSNDDWGDGGDDDGGGGDTATCPVPPGYFQSLLTGLNMLCPEGTRCAGGEAQPAPVKGYWSNYGFMMNDQNIADQVHQCHRRTCKGPGSQLDNDERVLACYSGSNYSEHKCVANELLCEEGAFGILCGSCKLGYTYSSYRKKCVGCDHDWTVSCNPEGRGRT